VSDRRAHGRHLAHARVRRSALGDAHRVHGRPEAAEEPSERRVVGAGRGARQPPVAHHDDGRGPLARLGRELAERRFEVALLAARLARGARAGELRELAVGKAVEGDARPRPAPRELGRGFGGHLPAHSGLGGEPHPARLIHEHGDARPELGAARRDPHRTEHGKRHRHGRDDSGRGDAQAGRAATSCELDREPTQPQRDHHDRGGGRFSREPFGERERLGGHGLRASATAARGRDAA